MGCFKNMDNQMYLVLQDIFNEIPNFSNLLMRSDVFSAPHLENYTFVCLLPTVSSSLIPRTQIRKDPPLSPSPRNSRYSDMRLYPQALRLPVIEETDLENQAHKCNMHTALNISLLKDLRKRCV